MRPANIITAISDVLAGAALALMLPFVGTPDIRTVTLLVLSTSFLYGGGVVLNDVFDSDLDKIERPERPIPSGLIKKSSAGLFGILLLLLGIVCAAFSDTNDLLSPSTWVATVIAIAATVYDRWAKHHSFFGPFTMGFCRGCNLLLGMTATGYFEFYYIGIVPLMYIFAITMISRGEVHGGKRTTLYLAALLYILVVIAILGLSLMLDTLPQTLPFVVFLVAMIFLPLQKAINQPTGPRIGKAVKSGVISLIIMNASWAAACDNLLMAFIILALLPISLLLARLFAVT